MRLRCVSQSGVSCCVSKAARAAPQSLSSVWIHVAPSIARHRLKKKKKKKRRGHQSACTRRKPPCTVGAACTARPEESEIEQRETVGSVLRTCKRHAAGTHRLRLQSSGPKRWTGGAALWALRCDAGEFGAVTVAVCCLLVATAFAAPGSPRGAHPTPPSGLHISCCNALRGVASTFVHLLMVINDCQSILI